ncbi:hypothetical protein [Olivibacter sitiensis]|uniref:hypothetical protein n=1 Tax=Olivibacter sitiensis TaxID=376470 RepID=UPI0004276DD2|nr:hypothetical protein [Olivibacter sitiensis]
MVTIKPNKLIIELEDVGGLEVDTLHRLHQELLELLQCALVLDESGDRRLTSAYYGTISLLKAIAPSFDDIERMEYDIPPECL